MDFICKLLGLSIVVIFFIEMIVLLPAMIDVAKDMYKNRLEYRLEKLIYENKSRCSVIGRYHIRDKLSEEIKFGKIRSVKKLKERFYEVLGEGK